MMEHNIRKIEVWSLPITLAQFLKWAGLAQTGSEAKSLVREGMVSLNGEVCNIPGKQLAVGDRVAVLNEQGKAVEALELGIAEA